MRNRGPALVRYSLIPPSPACRRFVVPTVHSSSVTAEAKAARPWGSPLVLSTSDRAKRCLLTPELVLTGLVHDVAPVCLARTPPREFVRGEAALREAVRRS